MPETKPSECVRERALCFQCNENIKHGLANCLISNYSVLNIYLAFMCLSLLASILDLIYFVRGMRFSTALTLIQFISLLQKIQRLH